MGPRHHQEAKQDFSGPHTAAALQLFGLNDKASVRQFWQAYDTLWCAASLTSSFKSLTFDPLYNKSFPFWLNHFAFDGTHLPFDHTASLLIKLFYFDYIVLLMLKSCYWLFDDPSSIKPFYLVDLTVFMIID